MLTVMGGSERIGVLFTRIVIRIVFRSAGICVMMITAGRAAGGRWQVCRFRPTLTFLMPVHRFPQAYHDQTQNRGEATKLA